MSVWPAAVKACTAIPLPKFSPAASIAGFDPSQRMEILDQHLPVPGALPDARALLDMGRFQFGLDAAGNDIFVGVGRKGRSFLDEVSRYFPISSNQLVGDGDLAALDLSGKRVLIVDDAIHTGQTMLGVVRQLENCSAAQIRACVVVASQDGLSKVQAGTRSMSSLRQVLLVPEQYYTGTYQRSVGPAMAYYQAGSLSNRPCQIMTAQAANYDDARAAIDALKALSNLDAAASFGQTPCTDTDQSPIFRGTIEFGDALNAEISQWSEGQEVEQAKARVFIDSREQLTIHLNGIYYPMADGAMTEAQVLALENSVCEKMLDKVARQVREGLLALGYSVSSPSST